MTALSFAEPEDWPSPSARSLQAIYQTRCDCCGRFVQEGASGVSWSQQWSYDMDGTPDLHDPAYRCSPCTDRHGVQPTNCNEIQGKYHGRNPIEPTTGKKTP